jgi:methionyl-tRNA formyltransferase
MKITLFTSNQPRHIALIEALAGLADELFVVQECNTVFPGEVADFYRRSDVMQAYFRRVIEAETEVFGPPRLGPRNVRSLAVKMGDLNRFALNLLRPALKSDAYVVFGASYIKGVLCDSLVIQRAYNIHMGVSPYYRGANTNFWALYDGHPEYVGATIHLLSSGLDSGAMLFHALPQVEAVDPFVLGMKAVRAAHQGLVEHLRSGALRAMEPVVQAKSLEMRYARMSEFTDEVAREYLERCPSPAEVKAAVGGRDMAKFLRPYVA